MAERDDRGMLRWKCWGRGDGSGGGDGGDGDCGARSHAACRGGPPWYAGEESSRAGRIFFASSALHRALGERQRFWFWAETRCTFLKRHFMPQEIDPLHQIVSPRATFISFRNVVAAPRYPDGRYAAGYRGAIKASDSVSLYCHGLYCCRRYSQLYDLVELSFF